MPEKQTRYDAIPYRSNPFRQSHPDHLAAVAKLFGLNAPSREKCRVLELGCSMGGNLIVVAQDYPGAQCLGIDASSRQISEGWKNINELGLTNIQLKHMDILDVRDDLGQFDYIISHGVYSWVPARVQEKMLEILQRHLAPDGVGYISYNTYPGWHIRGIARDIMLYRGMQFTDPETQLAQAKELLKFVTHSAQGTDTPYQRLLQKELDLLTKMQDYYLQHEHLEEHNTPVYFHEFAERLQTNGLQYLGDAEFSSMVSTNFSADVAKTLHNLGAHDIVQMEQYMDFVRCRYFRKTLICRSGVKLERNLSSGVVKDLFLSSNATPDISDLPLDPNTAVRFSSQSGYSITCHSPLTKLALQHLRETWPTPVPFNELARFAIEKSEAAGYRTDNPVDFLAGEILTTIGAGLLEWRLTLAPFTANVEERPATSPLARLQARNGYQVTNLRGELITLDEIHRQILIHLDGAHDHDAIADEIMIPLRTRELILRRDADGTPVEEEQEMRGVLDSVLDKVLANLASKALLKRTN
jgi:methyltransferase-like protein/SAM-dependent methyltransferase